MCIVVFDLRNSQSSTKPRFGGLFFGRPSERYKVRLTTFLTCVRRHFPGKLGNAPEDNEKLSLARRLLLRKVAALKPINNEADNMIDARKAMQTTDSVHLGFSEQRQPLLRGDGHRYLMGRGDQLAFAAEVVRFGFSPTDFTVDVERLPGKRSPTSAAATFTVTVENLRSRRRATYHGGPGRAWVAEFLRDLIAERFGQP